MLKMGQSLAELGHVVVRKRDAARMLGVLNHGFLLLLPATGVIKGARCAELIWWRFRKQS
ncbi:protein of unknown function [Candidatus Filomicrobium marinum]|nr:protein of unknown function [Candidatus Filomicrobium marinum]